MESSFMEKKENQPLVTKLEAQKNSPSLTVAEGLSSLREKDPEIADAYEREFSPEELQQIDDVLNRINETWKSLALADDTEGVKEQIRGALDEGKLFDRKKEIGKML